MPRADPDNFHIQRIIHGAYNTQKAVRIAWGLKLASGLS